jgi:hypothetical protein
VDYITRGAALVPGYNGARVALSNGGVGVAKVSFDLYRGQTISCRLHDFARICTSTKPNKLYISKHVLNGFHIRPLRNDSNNNTCVTYTFSREHLICKEMIYMEMTRNLVTIKRYIENKMFENLF